MIILIIVLGLIAGYREIQILCDRGSYYYLDFREWFWFTDQADKKVSNWDSFHVSNGLHTLVLCVMLTTCTSTFHFWANSQVWNIILQILILWFVYMYARNIMMHIILPHKPKWKYLSPIQF